MMLQRLDLTFSVEDKDWTGEYELGNYPYGIVLEDYKRICLQM